MLNRVKTTWLCDICKDYRNLGKSQECSSCGARRKKSRYVVNLDGIHYLCHLYTLKHTQLLSVMKVVQSEEDHTVVKVAYPSDADIAHEVVIAMTKRALDPPIAQPANAMSAPATDSPKSDNNAFSPPENSLFQRVMDEGTKLAYDSKIGRFVPVDTVDVLRPSPSKSKKKGAVIETVSTDLNYVKFMAQEKRIMKKVVEETIAIRNRLEHEQLVAPKLNRSLKQPCSLCEIELPEESLPGEISFKSVANWRADHGAPIPDSDHRFDVLNLYSKAKLCLFCTQFFETELAEVMEQSAKEMKSMKSDKFGTAVEDTTQVRPLSSIGRSVEISNLKMRAMRAMMGPLSIGTSSSVSVLEVKAKTVMSMAKINSDLHLYQLKEDRIMRNIYRKRRADFPNLSLEEFKFKLFESANLSLANPKKQDSSLNPTSSLENTVVGAPMESALMIANKAKARKMSLPELFLAAATNEDFRMMADPKLLKKRQSISSAQDVASLEEIAAEKRAAINYDPRMDFIPTKAPSGKSKSAASVTRSRVPFSSKMCTIQERLSEVPPKEKKISKCKNENNEVRNSWAALLSSGSPVKKEPLDENDPFALPSLVISEPVDKSRRPPPVSRIVASSSAKSLTRKSYGVPRGPPQSDPGPNALASAAKTEAASDELTGKTAPQWMSTTDASGVFMPVRKLKLREMSKPENQGKPQSPTKKKHTSKSSKKKGFKGNKDVEAKAKAKSVNKKLLAKRELRIEKAKDQVVDGLNAYSGKDACLGFKNDKDTNTTSKPQLHSPAIAPGTGKNCSLQKKNMAPKKAVSFTSNGPAIDIVNRLENLPPRPIQRCGSGLNISKTLRRTDSKKFLDEVSVGRKRDEADSSDIFVSRERPDSPSRTVSWHESMYNNTFEDPDENEEEFTTEYYLDDFESQEDFGTDVYEQDFEPLSRSPSFKQPLVVGNVAEASIWEDNVPRRAPSSHRCVRNARSAGYENSRNLHRGYSEDEFEPFDEPSKKDEDKDNQGYSSNEFEDEDLVPIQPLAPEYVNTSRAGTADFNRPSTSRRSTRGEFVNTMQSVGSRAFTPSKAPLSSHRRKRRSVSAVGGIDSPFQSRPSSSVSLRVMSPDKNRTPQPIVERRQSLFCNFDSRTILSQDMGTKDPALESAMQEYVDMLFAGDYEEDFLDEEEEAKPVPESLSAATSGSDSPQSARHGKLSSENVPNNKEIKHANADAPIVKKYNAVLPRAVVVTQSSIPEKEERRTEDTFEGTKTTRSGAVLPRIAHDIKTFPSQLDLTIMKRSGEIGKKADEKMPEDDALLSAVAKRLKAITTTSSKNSGARKM